MSRIPSLLVLFILLLSLSFISYVSSESALTTFSHNGSAHSLSSSPSVITTFSGMGWWRESVVAHEGEGVREGGEKFDLFTQPLATVVVVLEGTSKEHDSELLLNAPSALVTATDYSSLPGRTLVPTGDVQGQRLAKVLRAAGVADVRFDADADALVINGVSFERKSDHGAAVVRDLAALAMLHKSVQMQTSQLFSFRSLESLSMIHSKSSAEYAAARSAFARLLARFTQKVHDRVLITVLLRDTSVVRGAAAASATATRSSLSTRAVGADPNHKGPTMAQMWQYQLGVWTFILLAVVMIAFTVNTCNMSNSKDSFMRELYREENGPI